MNQKERMDAATEKPCCTPSLPRNRFATDTPSAELSRRSERAEFGGDMASLTGGTFLMGTDYPEAFAQDGEGPVRPVTLNAFEIDPFPVTNNRFREFIKATEYRTGAARYGWSKLMFEEQLSGVFELRAAPR